MQIGSAEIIKGVCLHCHTRKSEDLIFLGAKFCSAKCEADKAEAEADYKKSEGMVYHNPSTRGKSIEAIYFDEESNVHSEAWKKIQYFNPGKYHGDTKPLRKKENGDFDLGFKPEPLDLKDENEYWKIINQGIAKLYPDHSEPLPYHGNLDI